MCINYLVNPLCVDVRSIQLPLQHLSLGFFTESAEQVFNSKFNSDFEAIGTIGSGAFGLVIEARNKNDVFFKNKIAFS